MSKLAILGGQPVFEESLDWHAFWPPRDEATGRKLQELYFSGRWTAFDELEPEFAQAFATHHGAKHGAFMVNGTVTMQCALGAYGIGAGDEVIVPALTWYATGMAAYYLGAKPVFVDVLPDTLCIDPDKIAAAITERTKAIIPVHLYGSMADMDRIMAIARKHQLIVIEDCAHAHGGIWAGQGIGSIGDVGSFSFQQSKTMACGEGGICITSDSRIYERIFRMKQIGYGPGQNPGRATSGPPPDLLCYPFRATAFQALLLAEQLKSLNERLERYEKSARYLEERLGRTTNIRFQARGQRADRQGYFGWVMIFDHPEYADIPLKSIQNALGAEGLEVEPTWGAVYDFILFNLRPEAYRVDQPCVVTEQIGARMLWVFHANLGLSMAEVEKMADAIEKVAVNSAELRKHALVS
jgi:L-glutamine:2-deoxy-scyllo-inosose/3-amino-2,3-dideoxy-scyllo-inosose aminotransferase